MPSRTGAPRKDLVAGFKRGAYAISAHLCNTLCLYRRRPRRRFRVYPWEIKRHRVEPERMWWGQAGSRARWRSRCGDNIPPPDCVSVALGQFAKHGGDQRIGLMVNDKRYGVRMNHDDRRKLRQRFFVIHFIIFVFYAQIKI